MGFANAPQDWMYRATAFELLSLMFLMPTKELSEVLTCGELADACDEILRVQVASPDAIKRVSELLALYEGKDAEETFHALRKEHTRLFVGERLPLITPFVGVWAAEQRGQKALLFVGKESMAIERFMHRCGVGKNLEAGQVNDPLDHVGTVCEFLKYLSLAHADAIQVPSNAKVDDGDFDAFMNEQFAAYAEWLSRKLDELTRCDFYRAAALLLREEVALWRD